MWVRPCRARPGLSLPDGGVNQKAQRSAPVVDRHQPELAVPGHPSSPSSHHTLTLAPAGPPSRDSIHRLGRPTTPQPGWSRPTRSLHPAVGAGPGLTAHCLPAVSTPLRRPNRPSRLSAGHRPSHMVMSPPTTSTPSYRSQPPRPPPRHHKTPGQRPVAITGPHQTSRNASPIETPRTVTTSEPATATTPPTISFRPHRTTLSTRPTSITTSDLNGGNACRWSWDSRTDVRWGMFRVWPRSDRPGG